MMALLTPALLFFVLSLGFIVLLLFRPGLTAAREGKVLAFIGLFVMPTICVGFGLSRHLERSKETPFCLSCHTMEPYGQSLLVDDPAYIPARHFQNHLVPPDQACYTCHTDYTMYGGIRAKIRGMRHVYRQYITQPSQPIHLYTAYNNRECLRCHAGGRSFEEKGPHPALRDDLLSNQLSCLTSGCHDTIHNVAGLGGVQLWSKPQ